MTWLTFIDKHFAALGTFASVALVLTFFVAMDVIEAWKTRGRRGR